MKGKKENWGAREERKRKKREEGMIEDIRTVICPQYLWKLWAQPGIIYMNLQSLEETEEDRREKKIGSNQKFMNQNLTNQS